MDFVLVFVLFPAVPQTNTAFQTTGQEGKTLADDRAP